MYKVEDNVISLDDLMQLLRMETKGQYLVEPYRKTTQSSSESNMLMVKKNNRHGLLLTFDPYLEDRKYAIIYTIPYTPNELLNWLTHRMNFFNLFSRTVLWKNSKKIQTDISKILLARLKACSVDSSHGV